MLKLFILCHCLLRNLRFTQIHWTNTEYTISLDIFKLGNSTGLKDGTKNRHVIDRSRRLKMHEFTLIRWRKYLFTYLNFIVLCSSFLKCVQLQLQQIKLEKRYPPIAKTLWKHQKSSKCTIINNSRVQYPKIGIDLFPYICNECMYI